MSNYHLRDENLSYIAKGLLPFMLLLPDDCNIFQTPIVVMKLVIT